MALCGRRTWARGGMVSMLCVFHFEGVWMEMGGRVQAWMRSVGLCSMYSRGSMYEEGCCKSSV